MKGLYNCQSQFDVLKNIITPFQQWLQSKKVKVFCKGLYNNIVKSGRMNEKERKAQSGNNIEHPVIESRKSA